MKTKKPIKPYKFTFKTTTLPNSASGINFPLELLDHKMPLKKMIGLLAKRGLTINIKLEPKESP